MSYPNGAKFTPPLAQTLPAFLPDTTGPEFGLAKYRNVLSQGVTVYAMSDGTFTQDFPTTENTNTNIPPYPLMPDQELPNIISRTYTIVPISQLGTSGNVITTEIPGSRANGLCTGLVTVLINPYATFVYFGGRTYTVNTTVANALANYTAHGAGYADSLVAL